MKKLFLWITLCVLLVVVFTITTSYFVASAESYTVNDNQYSITFERTDWTNLKNTSSNPLGTFSGTFENVNVGLHSDGLQMKMNISQNYLIQVAYSSGSMQWGNDIEFSVGSSQSDLPSYTGWTLEPNKQYSINTVYRLMVKGSSFEFPFLMNFSYTNTSETTINLNYDIVYSYLYIQPLAMYGVGLPKIINFEFLGLENSQVMFNYLNSEYGISNTTRVYNVGSTFGVLPEIPYLPDYVIDYYWAYDGELNTELTIDSIVQNKQVFAVYKIDMSLLSNEVLSDLQNYYEKAYNKGLADGIAQGSIIEKPLELWGSIFSKIGTFFDIQLLPGITIGGLILIPTAFTIVLIILKLVRG